MLATSRASARPGNLINSAVNLHFPGAPRPDYSRLIIARPSARKILSPGRFPPADSFAPLRPRAFRGKAPRSPVMRRCIRSRGLAGARPSCRQLGQGRNCANAPSKSPRSLSGRDNSGADCAPPMTYFNSSGPMYAV